MKLQKLFILVTVLFFHFTSSAQMQMGIAHDNVNVTEGIRINPALAVDPVTWLDVHVGGMYIFGASNGAFLAKAEFSIIQGKFPDELSQNYSISKVDGQIEASFYGPAINASIGKFSIGLSSAFKTYAVGRDITPEFTQGLIDGLRIPEYYGVPLEGEDYRTKALSYIELGLNGGMIAYQKGKIIVNVGLNFKYLLGVGGINLLVDEFDYEMQDSSIATVSKFTGKYGGSDFAFHPGVGYGADLGVTLEKKITPSRYYKPHSPQSNCKYVDYIYRLGFSILDLGSIKFSGDYREVNNGSGPWIDYGDTRTSEVSAIVEDLDAIFEGNISESSSEYKASLPLAFSLQYDYNFGRGVFLNSTLVYGVALKNRFGGERMSMLAVTPRYEGKRFGIAAPVSINQTWKPALGLGLRFWFLTIGTDNIAPFFINMDVYRLDMYAHVKVPIFVNKQCKKRGMGEPNWRFSDCSAPGAYQPRKRNRRK